MHFAASLEGPSTEIVQFLTGRSMYPDQNCVTSRLLDLSEGAAYQPDKKGLLRLQHVGRAPGCNPQHAGQGRQHRDTSRCPAW